MVTKNLDFNLLISYLSRHYREAEEEARRILAKLGDSQPFVSKTQAKGIAGIKTKLKNREVITGIRQLFKTSPFEFNFVLKWVPVDIWCSSDLEQMKAVVDKIKDQIKPNEKWAMKVEKRRYQLMTTEEIIKALASLIREKVDLSHPNKILRLDIIGDQTGISILGPKDIFSLAKPL